MHFENKAKIDGKWNLFLCLQFTEIIYAVLD